MMSIFVNQNGRTDTVERVDPAWLDPASGARVWVDLAGPTPEELTVLSDVFHFHPLAVEDAVAKVHHPKIESYDGYLYLILHGIDYKKSETAFATHDIDFFGIRRHKADHTLAGFLLRATSSHPSCPSWSRVSTAWRRRSTTSRSPSSSTTPAGSRAQ